MTGNICFDCAAVAYLPRIHPFSTRKRDRKNERHPAVTKMIQSDSRGPEGEDMDEERIIPEQRRGATVISFLCRCAEQ